MTAASVYQELAVPSFLPPHLLLLLLLLPPHVMLLLLPPHVLVMLAAAAPASPMPLCDSLRFGP
jgi:hypothetical protein